MPSSSAQLLPSKWETKSLLSNNKINCTTLRSYININRSNIQLYPKTSLTKASLFIPDWTILLVRVPLEEEEKNNSKYEGLIITEVGEIISLSFVLSEI